MVLGKLIRSFGSEPPKRALPIVGPATLGRSVRLDPSMLAAMEGALGEPVSPDLVITGQGLIAMEDDAGTTYLHRFYDDEDRMLQALTDSEDGGDALEWSFYVPAGSEYLASGTSVSDWTARLSRAHIEHDGERFERTWYDDDTREQPPVRFTELVYEDETGQTGRNLPQECMVYARDTAQGELLLLALVMGEGEEASFERMLGTGLRPHQVTV
ncbi:DUF2491 family protein [Parvularcula dongshanensis]|uniref:DUF2491 family protein n=1 Tax=Parvularcula dongshanensis TaxID=1173995 RepID=A0A840I436_9PROT|nr:DUF2491 family protein [Parvularcula dongshanensis]MBB4659756.1 hypothetical protein [Parvularcula dongshanensis]